QYAIEFPGLMVTMTRHTFLGPRTCSSLLRARSRQARTEPTVWAATTMPRITLPRFVRGSFIPLVYSTRLQGQHLLHSLTADAEFPRDVGLREALGDQVLHHPLASLMELLSLDPVRECFGPDATKLIELVPEVCCPRHSTMMTTRVVAVN